MNLFVISDTHFSHENIIKYCGRPFANAAEMDEVLVENWNATVKPGDHVYHLGDVALRKQQLGIVKRLNGKRRLVLGNHDIFEAKDYLAVFEKVMAIRVLDGIIFTHIPIHPESMGRFRANIHGHLHEKTYPFPYLNVSVERTGYRPVALETLKQQIVAAQQEVELTCS